jgi:AcrR family transcriptional regulator
MGRASLAASRRREMVESIGACIAEHGLAASTQAVIARESGFSRSHIHHYLGTRDDVIDAVWDHLVTAYRGTIARGASAEPDTATSAEHRWTSTALVDLLFPPEAGASPERRAIEAMIRESAGHRRLRARIEEARRDLVALVAEQLAAPAYAGTSAADAAFGLVALAIGSSALAAVLPDHDPRPAARRLALRILEDADAR